MAKAAGRRPTDPKAAPATRKKAAKPVPANVAFHSAVDATAESSGAKPCQVPPRNAAAPTLAKPAAHSRVGSDPGPRRFRARRIAPASAVRPSA